MCMCAHSAHLPHDFQQSAVGDLHGHQPVYSRQQVDHAPAAAHEDDRAHTERGAMVGGSRGTHHFPVACAVTEVDGVQSVVFLASVDVAMVAISYYAAKTIVYVATGDVTAEGHSGNDNYDVTVGQVLLVSGVQ